MGTSHAEWLQYLEGEYEQWIWTGAKARGVLFEDWMEEKAQMMWDDLYEH